MTTRDEDRQRLERLAQQRQAALPDPYSSDDPVGYCWEMVARGVHYGQLDAEDMQEAVDALKRGEGFGSGEIGFEPREVEVAPDAWEKQIQVSLLKEIVNCPFGKMIEEMQGPLEAYHQS